jgi:heme/copper-type cytochrome/quinol oxidase subunit 2
MTNIASIIWGRPLSAGLLVLVVLGVLLWTIFLYRRTKGVKNGPRYGLAALRVSVLLLIVFALLEPNVTETKTIERKQHLPVLLDVSKSMSLKDQRKQPQDIVDAATALGLVPFDAAADANATSMQLDTRQRALIASASRLSPRPRAWTSPAA